MTETLSALLQEGRTFPPPPDFVKRALITDASVYDDAERDWQGLMDLVVEVRRLRSDYQLDARTLPATLVTAPEDRERWTGLARKTISRNRNICSRPYRFAA
jgi:hypothetical protein